jgi:hypothetical protein
MSALECSVTEQEGIRGQYWDNAKWAIHAAFLTVISASYVYDTPVASRVARSLSTCGRNCGTPSLARLSETPLARIIYPAMHRSPALQGIPVRSERQWQKPRHNARYPATSLT